MSGIGKKTVIATKNEKLPLTKKESRFCDIYCQFGISGFDAVIQAGYKVSNKNTAYSIASENLRKPKIREYIKELYQEFKFTDADVLREHLFLIKQHANLASKARAIDMYYKKNGFYATDKAENINTHPIMSKFADMTDEQLIEEINSYTTRLKLN